MLSAIEAGPPEGWDHAAEWAERIRGWARRCERLLVLSPDAVERVPELLGVSLRSGRLRIYSADPEGLLESWRSQWPFPDLHLKGERWVEPDMEDVFNAYSQGYDAMIGPTS